MDELDPYRAWAEDADVLAEIGREFFAQPLRIKVRLPRRLADLALAAWSRDDPDGDLGEETPEQRHTRHRAGTLGLIGLSVEQDGVHEGDYTVVDLDAWFIGGALDAADSDGLLKGVSHTQP